MTKTKASEFPIRTACQPGNHNFHIHTIGKRVVVMCASCGCVLSWKRILELAK